jgi:hypothetical protein
MAQFGFHHGKDLFVIAILREKIIGPVGRGGLTVFRQVVAGQNQDNGFGVS